MPNIYTVIDSSLTPTELLKNIQTFLTKAFNQINETPITSSPKSNSSTTLLSHSNSRLQGQIWIDYFNNTLKCWEPFLDPLEWIIYYENVIIIIFSILIIIISLLINNE